MGRDKGFRFPIGTIVKHFKREFDVFVDDREYEVENVWKEKDPGVG